MPHDYTNKTKRKIEPLGVMHGAGVLMMLMNCGDADAQDGTGFKLCATPSGNPAVVSKQTGRVLVINWQELIQYAINNGIDAVD